MRVRVAKPHDSEPTVALIVREGEELTFERRPTVWEGWVWCTSSACKSGWVPESWLIVEGTVCKAARDYDSSELRVGVGDEVDALLFESGWVWVRGQGGKTGWVPVACLENV